MDVYLQDMCKILCWEILGPAFFGDTRDLGEMTKFLLSDGAKYITGQDFAVDGGALAYGF